MPDGFKGKKNIYTCDKCLGHVVTVDRDDGVTPFIINCKATADCRGYMRSSMYRVFDQTMRPEYEWFTPTSDELERCSSGEREHVEQGGLLLREILPASPPPQPGR